ncbi:stress protein [Humibacillus sp. DSM 29435]|uniref:TerD family protein n=1 Tax=Humibacillus sp. DSM 29435 TaxID=1869167 RepID=UPI000872B300|nr:TerD family protein [Humibacillus sp. DSM 29435]OFE16150.1 stress protein [Humibacillus sp. DSM 29435]
MAAPMRRGSNVALTREIPSLDGVVIGVKLSSAEPVVTDNLVVATILCDEGSHALSDEHFVFFNQLSTPELSVTQLRAAVGGDTEQIEVDLHAVPTEVSRIVVIAYINEGVAARRSLGQLREASVRVLNLDGNAELVRSENLAPALSTETGLALGELYRHQGGWKFKVIGQGYDKGIVGMAADFGVSL